ncbi:MAG: helix-turn-helix transcriptional regulator [Anaerostipes sp.]
MNDMLVHAEEYWFCFNLRRTGLLYEFLSILAENPMETDTQTDSEYVYINKAVEYIKNNYWDGIHIYDIAKYLCIDRSYVYLLFQKYFQQSPQDYLATFSTHESI